MAKVLYQAVVGMDFESLKPPVRVEAGDPIPEKASAEDIKWLLEQGHIKKVSPDESEGDK